MSLQQLQGNDIQGRAGPSLLSSAVRMNSILWFITDAPLSRLLRQPPTVFLGAFMSEYTHVMFPPKSGPCITQQPHIGSVPANNPNFHLSNFKVCSIHCNKSQPAHKFTCIYPFLTTFTSGFVLNSPPCGVDGTAGFHLLHTHRLTFRTCWLMHY